MAGSRHLAYLHARVSSMAGRLLSSQGLERLADLSLEELGQQFDLAPLLDESLPGSVRNRAVERALIRTLLMELSILVRPMTGEARDLVIYWARKFELHNLKALIRGKLKGLSEREIEDSLHDLPDFLGLPHPALLRTESVLELLRQMEQRDPYRAIASQARQVYEERHEPFVLEATIDQRYYAGLVKRVRQMRGEDLLETQHTVGLLLDDLNLLWVLRYRFCYQLSPSEAYYQMVPSSLRMHRARLLKLVNLATFDKVLEALPAPLNGLLAGADTASEVLRRLDTRTAALLRHLLRSSPSAVARALAYLILREMDLRKLFAVVQARVLGLDTGLLRYAMGLGQMPQGALHV